MSRNSITRTVLMLTLLAGGTLAFADPGATPPPAKPEDALKGPSVPDRHVPGVDNGLGEKGRGGKKDGTAQEIQIPQRAFMQMVEGTLGGNAAENLRMTDTQHEQIRKLNDDFGAKQKAFMTEHETDIKALLKEHPEMIRVLRENGFQVPGGRPGAGGDDKRPGGRPGKGPENGPGKGPEGAPPPGDMMQPPPGPGGPPGEPMNPEMRAKLQEKIQELKALAPRQEDTRTAIWAILTKDQQAAVQTKVDEFKAQRAKEMDDRYKQREKEKLQERGQKGDTKKGIPGTPGGPGGDIKPLTAEQRQEVLKSLPDDAQKRIGGLPAEQQERILNRLGNIPAEKRGQALEEMKKRLQEGGKGGKRPGQPAPEPK